MELDELDKRILQQLQKDSNLTNQALSEIVHASAPTCLRRVRQLHQRGIIQKTVAIVDPTRVATTLTAIVEVTLDVQTAEAYRDFEESVAREQSILQAYRVSSGPDFVLIVQVQDMPAYHALVHRFFTAQKNVRNVRSFFSVHRSKFETQVAID
ncbi:AsnC family transcriptional regulator [Advenella sp. S44]|uniref:Lrp/AsnC family transcriptional regulator n=1 Tax=Advenella sp. S44 TaxID=1982755 RepID=UPI000C2B231D|nr:Lrp/AsnC family transcriptional regulator [Advenella sp. S44]PJX25295.1 AsnC family transcriptional regulator [Advenella sp. S44]